MELDLLFPAPGHDHRRCVAKAMSAADELCDARGARLTALRRQVLELIWSNHEPVGAYDILEKLSTEDRRVAPMTVYRALDFLTEQGLVHRLASRNAFVGCDHPRGDGHDGQFLICTACGRVAEIHDRDISRAIVDGAARSGFHVASPVVEVEGLCSGCRVKTADA